MRNMIHKLNAIKPCPKIYGGNTTGKKLENIRSTGCKYNALIDIGFLFQMFFMKFLYRNPTCIIL